jgi:hypothetical protein
MSPHISREHLTYRPDEFTGGQLPGVHGQEAIHKPAWKLDA